MDNVEAIYEELKYEAVQRSHQFYFNASSQCSLFYFKNQLKVMLSMPSVKHFVHHAGKQYKLVKLVTIKVTGLGLFK